MLSDFLKNFLPNKVRLILLLLIFRISTPQWSYAASEIVEAPYEVFELYNGNLISLWGAIQAEWHRLTPYIKATITLPEFLTPLPIAMMLKRDTLQHILKAPLVIYLPGLFSDAVESMNLRSMTWFSQLGYHVVVFPNSWSQSYASRLSPSAYSPGAFYKEGLTVLSATQEIKAKIGEDKISTVTLIGESYGSLLASVAFSEDSNNARPIFDGKVILISPPINLTKAIKNLDQAILHAQTDDARPCRNSVSKSELFLSLLLAPHPSYLLASTLEFGNHCAKDYIVSVFQDYLEKTYQALPKFQSTRVPLGKKMLFEEFCRTYTPENVSFAESFNGANSISFWLLRIQPKAFERLKMITANGDLLNEGLSWDDVEVIQKHPEIFTKLNWGGHLGFIALPEFQSWIKKHL